MARSQDELITIDGEISGAIATTQLVRFHLLDPSDNIWCQEDASWLDMCLTPRPLNVRARYCDRWGPNRFQRVGGILLMPAGHALQIKADGGDHQTSVVCKLRSEALRDWFEGDLEWTDRRLEANLDIANPNIRSLLLRLGDEIRHPGFASEALAELIAAQLAIELCRYWSAVAKGPAAGGLAPWRLRLIDDRLMELREAPALGELAELCNLSVRQLTRGFRASRGCSIGDYVTSSRADLAKRLLSSDESVKAIAYSMGFSSPSSFSYAFRRATGETPRQFRQRSHRARR